MAPFRQSRRFDAFGVCLCDLFLPARPCFDRAFSLSRLVLLLPSSTMGTRTYYEAFNDSGLYDSDDSLDDFANSYRPAKKSKPSEPDQTTVFSQAHVACLGLTLLSLSEITNIASRHGATVSDKLEPGKTTLVFRGSRLRDKEWRKIQEARIPSAPEENFLMWIAMGQRSMNNSFALTSSLTDI